MRSPLVHRERRSRDFLQCCVRVRSPRGSSRVFPYTIFAMADSRNLALKNLPYFDTQLLFSETQHLDIAEIPT